MSIRWHKIDVVFHLRGGQSVKVGAHSINAKVRNNDLAEWELTYYWRNPRRPFYTRLDSIDSIEIRRRGWWRWAW